MARYKFFPTARLRNDGKWYVSFRLKQDLLFAVDEDRDERDSAEVASAFEAAAWLRSRFETEVASGKMLNRLVLPKSLGMQSI